MTVRLQVSVTAPADPATVWRVLTDWAGQSRWIPLTTVRITTAHQVGLGVRAVALSGFWLGRWPLGLLDRFVVTGWAPPTDSPGELEVLHLGPYFTGEGVFRVEPTDAGGSGTRITATEVFSLPGGRLTEAPMRLALPLMRRAFTTSLAGLGRISAAATAEPD